MILWMCFGFTKRPLLFLMNIIITVYKTLEYDLILKTNQDRNGTDVVLSLFHTEEN